jgi:uncharacterized protein
MDDDTFQVRRLHMSDEYDRAGLLSLIRDEFALDWNGGIHGVNHWSRVLHHGKKIGRIRKADLLVVELFAFLHDSCRFHDGQDKKHGERAAEFACYQQKVFFQLKPKQLEKLLKALRYHSDGKVSADKTIQTCWDADRLDLGRVGIYPSSEFMSHEAEEFIESAFSWSRRR